MTMLAMGPANTRISTNEDGRLLVERDGELLLVSAVPPVRARYGETWQAVTDFLTIPPWPTSDGFLLTLLVKDADEIEIAWELASGGHWFGMGEWIHQHWPLERGALPLSPLLTWDNGPSGLGGVLEPLWLTHTGIGLWVQEEAALSVGLNAPRDALPIPPWDLSPGQHPAIERPASASTRPGDGLLRLRVAGDALTLHLFTGANLQETQRAFVTRAGRPQGSPPASLLQLPIWTTWARYKNEINQTQVLQFVDEIQAQGFPIGTLEIDDRWQHAYGDLFFDQRRFPDPAGMIADLHARGIQVTAWVIPFVTAEAHAFQEALAQGFLIRGDDGQPHPIVWWQGPGYTLDISNDAALEWFRERLQRLQQETGLDGFKFDAGEVCFLPPGGQSAAPLPGNSYTRRYVNFVATHFPYSEVRAGWRTQRAPILVREWDKYSIWGRENGLQAVLTQALTLSLIGYPFVLADMIGGNEYGTQRADGELMVRWAQANALLPAMQFSLAPWEYGAEISVLCREAAALHVRFGPELERLAAEAVATGNPMVRPLVWQFPHDLATPTIWDQFMLGDCWLVAPVVTPGSHQRDIYFPPGTWRSPATGGLHKGPSWHHAYPAPLDTLPYFERVDS